MLTLHFAPERSRAEARACVDELEELIKAEHPEVLDVSIHTEDE
jgi:divalent metal cation (Fe/Co/Zn/Cd) transporter